LNCTILENIIT